MTGMGILGETAAILAAARRYVIHKSVDGITVGLLFDDSRYAEARSPQGDVDAAIKEAFERAKSLAVPAADRPHA